MRLPPVKKTAWIVSALVLGGITFSCMSSGNAVDFNTEVKPIFNKKCITCHGGVKRQSGFSLLFRSDAVAINKSGLPAIIPGDPSHSELIRRLTLKDPEERMPYKHPPYRMMRSIHSKNGSNRAPNGAITGPMCRLNKPRLLK
jgi:hypothetical protein